MHRKYLLWIAAALPRNCSSANSPYQNLNYYQKQTAGELLNVREMSASERIHSFIYQTTFLEDDVILHMQF